MRKFSILFALAVSLPSLASADIISNLQEYWSLDGNTTAGVTATNDATYMGTGSAAFGIGKFGQGIDLERDTGDYLSIGGSGAQFDNVDGSVTVSAWFTTESLGTGWQAIVSNGEGSAWRLARQGTTTSGAYAGGTGDITGGDISTLGFHHIVGVTEAGVSTRLWLDGALIATSAGVPALTGDRVGTLQTLIGNNPESLGRSWDGIIDDVAIWNIALTDAEIGRIWNDGTGRSIASIVAVPEPSSLALCLFGGVAALARRRKR